MKSGFDKRISPELEWIWEEGCKALGIPKPENWYALHPDKFFENVRYAGRGKSS